MQIHVTTLLGKKFDVEIDESSTLRDLKAKVEGIEWIHSDWQRFVFDSIELLDDDGLVVDQVNEIIRQNEGEPIEGDSCISLWLILRLKGGGNIIYHKPIQQHSSSSSDSDSDDTELIPRNRQNVAFLKPDKIECNPSSDSHVLLPNGSPESAVSNGADANGPEHNTSETRVKGLPDSLKPSQENGIREDSDATNIFPEKGHSVWMFASDAGISVNVGLLMIAAAVFLVPKAMREIPQISRMLQSKVGKHDGIERILKRTITYIAEFKTSETKSIFRGSADSSGSGFVTIYADHQTHESVQINIGGRSSEMVKELRFQYLISLWAILCSRNRRASYESEMAGETNTASSYSNSNDDDDDELRRNCVFSKMRIRVNKPLGKMHEVEIDESDCRLRDLKCKFEGIVSVPSTWQRFLFNRIELLDDDGLVVDQVNEIIRRNQGEPIEGHSCINLWMLLNMKGGGNIIYHSPARSQHGSSSLSDSETDDREPPPNRQNEAFGRPDQVECSSSDQSPNELLLEF
ncbi:hypothetical protein Sjap_022959 [Stephania japonica]|uniref:Ubiquitin-like domain-containing protein n=1 Tax=Stephania japonica TaxID=461633 RepID=A0AAP0ESW4_9MAGN